MMNKILTKWVEPYVLLETLKLYFPMRDFTFDGYSKINIKKEFLSQFEKYPNSVGLYMKNVNKFYLFNSDNPVDLSDIFDFENNDYIISEDIDEPFNMIDMGKAEASFINVN